MADQIKFEDFAEVSIWAAGFVATAEAERGQQERLNEESRVERERMDGAISQLEREVNNMQVSHMQTMERMAGDLSAIHKRDTEEYAAAHQPSNGHRRRDAILVGTAAGAGWGLPELVGFLVEALSR